MGSAFSGESFVVGFGVGLAASMLIYWIVSTTGRLR